MSKAAVKISADLLSNPLCEQDQAFLDSMTALDTAMKRMDAFNQEKVRFIPTKFHCFTVFVGFALAFTIKMTVLSGLVLLLDMHKRKLDSILLNLDVFIFIYIV